MKTKPAGRPERGEVAIGPETEDRQAGVSPFLIAGRLKKSPQTFLSHPKANSSEIP